VFGVFSFVQRAADPDVQAEQAGDADGGKDVADILGRDAVDAPASPSQTKWPAPPKNMMRLR